VNSERPGFEWLLPLSGNNHFDKRPDFVICNPCFYDVYAKPSVENGVLDVEQRLLGERKEKLLFASLLTANKSSAFHRITLFDREKFLLILSLHGTFASAV